MTDENNNIQQPDPPQEGLVGFAKRAAKRRVAERAAARERKRAQRAREKQGIVAGAVNRLRESWSKNLESAKQNPELNAALTNRLFDFTSVREEMRAAVERLRNGVHAEAPGAGRFPEMIALDLLELVQKYGGPAPLMPPVVILTKIESMNTAHQQAEVDRLANLPEFHFRMTFGLDIDAVSNLECDGYFSVFFTWFLAHRHDSDYDYGWEIADQIVRDFKIDERLLTGVFADPRGIWARLQRYRRGLTDVVSNPALADPEESSRIRIKAEIQRDNNFTLPSNFQL